MVKLTPGQYRILEEEEWSLEHGAHIVRKNLTASWQSEPHAF
jgi:hypothetical protein